MTNSTEGTRTCGYPGCERAAQASTGPGRPPEYCEDPEHTALKAWRARHATGRAEQQQPDDLGRPVSMAAARGSALRDELVRTVTQMQDQLTRVMADMRTLGDPDAAAAQIETVTVEATQRIASSDAARVAAETAARQARELAEQADTAAAELDAQLQQARADLAELGEQAEQTRAQLTAAAHRA